MSAARRVNPSIRSSVSRSAMRLACIALLAGVLAACGGVQIKPAPELPQALVQPLPAKVGVVIPAESRNFVHKETRWGIGWEADLGSGHVQMVEQIFKSAFRDYVLLESLEAAKQTPDLKAIFEPRIDQFSFVTARETGGRYYAVTIRYRINLYTPQAELADSYTLTGYGNALARGMSSVRPLEAASRGAMRDAAAKFLVQFPEQPPAQRLAKNEPVIVEQSASAGSFGGIEAVPIHEEGAAAKPAEAPKPAPPEANLPLPKDD